MNSRTVAVKPFLDALVRYWDTFSADWDALGVCRELAPPNQESTTYEPSLVCKLLILGCRILIPDRLLETVRWLLFGFRCLLDALRLRGPKTPRERVHRVRGVASTGVPTATASASSSPPDWI